MARLLGPDNNSRMAVLPSGAPASGRSGTVYANAAGTVLADILVYQPGNPTVPGAAIAGSVVTTDAYGMLSLFWWPDSVDVVWISVNGGPVVPINADYDARLDAVGVRVTAIEPGGAAVALRAASNLSDLANAGTARTSLGLGNVDNTADAAKPVSTAQQAAVDLKVRGGPLLRFGPGFLPRWRKALANVRNGAADAKLLCIGDSTTAGFGGSTAATIPVNKSYSAALASLLNTYLIPAANGLAVPRSNINTGNVDDRWSAAAGWTTDAFGMAGNAAWRGRATAGVSTSFADSRVMADRFDVYYVTNAGLGTLGLTATGGATSNINTAGAAGIAKVTLSAAAAATSNTVVATQTGGDVHIVGIEPWLSTSTRVRVGNAGVGSSKTADWNNNPATFGAIPTIKAYAPALAIISLGINDAGASVTTATYLANLQQIIDAAAITADVILLTQPPPNPASVPTHASGVAGYAPALNGLTNYAVADLYTRSGGWTVWNSNGFQTDQVHPNDFGYWDMGQLLFAGLSAA